MEPRDPTYGEQDEPLTLFDELRDEAVMASVRNGLWVPGKPVFPERAIPGKPVFPELTDQEVGDSAELHFGGLVNEHHLRWQPAGTAAQPHDCLVISRDGRMLVQVKGSQTQQPEGFYKVDLGAHRVEVDAFAVMVRHESQWLSPFIIPAGVVRTVRKIRVWPVARRLRRGTFDAYRWRSAWWVIDPAIRNQWQRDVLLFAA